LEFSNNPRLQLFCLSWLSKCYLQLCKVLSIVNWQRRAWMIYLGAYSVNTLWLQNFQKIVMADSSRGITSLNNTDVCLPVFKERENHIHLNFLQPSRNVVYTHLPPTDIWKFKWPKTLRFCKENRQLTGAERGEGQGIPLHDGEGMKSCVTISASLKQLLVSPRLKSSTVYLTIYPIQIF
jgi:hypothetical protein